VVVLARHDHVRVRRLHTLGQPFERVRRASRRIFLVHLVEQRQPPLNRTNEKNIVPAFPALVDDEARGLDPLPRRADGPIEDEQVQFHEFFLRRTGLVYPNCTAPLDE
jgi:hypothetical protein